MEAVDPDVAIWSAGAVNPYCHPSPNTLARLAAQDIEVHGTATKGTIIICTDGQTYHLGACDAPEINFHLMTPGISNEPVATSTPTPTATTQGEPNCHPHADFYRHSDFYSDRHADSHCLWALSLQREPSQLFRLQHAGAGML